MSTTALKLGSLAVRTLAKPIASRIKQQARDHPKFRKVCVSLAQQIHRVDMRLRLGLLRDPAAIEREHKRHEAAERERRHAEALRKMKEAEAIYPGVTATVSSDTPVPPSPEQEKTLAAKEKEEERREKEKKPAGPRIRPLSESKAIDAGANFISEAFLFAVAGALILLEQLRSRRKEANRRDEVQERLELLEARTRQDEERLLELEERDHRSEERILVLEEELWRRKGGKGEFPGRRKRDVVKRVHEPTPLWEAPAGDRAGFWQRVWEAVTPAKETETDLEKGEVVLTKPAGGIEGAVVSTADGRPAVVTKP